MPMPITRGKISTGERFCVYGSEGIGKSTFVSQIPGIVFIDTEGSTNNMDVHRLPSPYSWQMLMDEVDDAIRNAGELNALVIDTADWAERLLIEKILADKKIASIGDIPYGNGYEILKDEFGKLLNKLTELSKKGVHVGFTAHAMMRKFEQPDELGAYDRWEMKTSKKVAPLIKEWASICLFANYKTLVYSTDKNGTKHKASGGQRVMYTEHHPCWDAKNRHGLPEELPFDFSQVAHIFQPVGSRGTVSMPNAEALPIPPALMPQQIPENNVPTPQTAFQQQAVPTAEIPQQPTITTEETAPQQAEMPISSEGVPVQNTAPMQPDPAEYQDVPPALIQLMQKDGISPKEVQSAVAVKGVFPLNTPWSNYPSDFKDFLIAHWDQMRDTCLQLREDAPF